MDSNFNVDKFHEVDENPSSWKLRKRFLQAHWNKFPEDRLVCLSKCFVNVEQDGCRYPDRVMEQLAKLCKELPEIIEEQRENRKRKAFTMNFVKASDNQEIGSSSVNTGPPISSITTHVGPTPHLFQNNASYGFVKSNVEYKSTDISDNSYEGIDIKSKRIGNKKSKSASENFKMALQDLQTINENREMEERDLHFLSLGKTVDLLQNPSKNDIEILYEAASKVHMTVQFNTDYVEDGSCFECVVQVDSVEIAKQKGLNKKAAKHNAFKAASKKLLMKYLRVISSILESSDVPFFTEEMAEDNEVSYESNWSQLPKRNFKTRYENNLNPLSRFLIMQPLNVSTISSIQILRQSADFNKALLSYSFNPDIGGMKCCIAINEVPIVDCLACTKQAAKTKASDMALELLKDQCWTVCLKQAVDTDAEGLSKEEVLGDIDKRTEQIPDSNIGNKLLRKMGWAGGGVGKDGTGITNPIAVEQVINREGLGLESQKGIPIDVKTKLESLILNYARSSREDDLVFAPDFTKDERAILHQYSQKLGLVSRSHGKGDNRYLTVKRKRSADQLFNHIMKHGGSTAKYDLFAPGTLQSD